MTEGTAASGGSSARRPEVGLVGVRGLPAAVRPEGVSVGTAPQLGQSAFQMSFWYVPSVVEALVTLGVLAFGGLVFSVAAWVLPLQEAGSPDREPPGT